MRSAESCSRSLMIVAVNREWAGLHYASDSAAGKKLARAVFPYVERAYRETFAAAAREWL